MTRAAIVFAKTLLIWPPVGIFVADKAPIVAKNFARQMTLDTQETWFQLLSRWSLRLILIAGIVVLAGSLFNLMDSYGAAMDDNAKMAMSLTFLLAYALLIAIPFVPAIEIAVTVVVMRGPEAAPFVYAATVFGLMLAYMAGRYMPQSWLQRTARDSRLHRLEKFLHAISTKTRPERLDMMRSALPRRIARVATDYRYLMIAALINLPGSSLIGGGGGIMMMAGITRLFSAWGLLLTVTLAIAPAPLIIYFFEIDILARFH